MLSQISMIPAPPPPPGPTPTIASQAVAAGRPALASSFRFHRPRGPLCGRGYCSQCEVVGPEGRILACQAAAAVPPRRWRDPLRPLGRVAERLPPWFYERRFLWPRPLDRVPLHFLRHLTAAAPLSDAVVPARVRAFGEVEVELVAVGAAAARDGAFVVDRDAGDVALGIYPERTLGVLRDDRFLAVRFERLVLGAGSYVRLPPVVGNDLPGVLALDAAEAYGAAGALRRGTRIAVWAPEIDHARAAALAERHGLAVVWLSATAPAAIAGRREVRAVVAGERVPCELFVVGVRQPALEFALQAGARAALTSGELPILAVADAPPWLELEGACGAQGSGVPDVRPDDAAIACACEDVRVGDLKACVAQGFADVELVKRRTGAMTGPCQGKVCGAAVLAVLRDAGVEARPPRPRPLASPVPLRELAADA